MKLIGLDAVQNYRRQKKNENFEAWGIRHGLGPIHPVVDERALPGNEGERDYADEDYAGPGLEAAFWDVPNM